MPDKDTRKAVREAMRQDRAKKKTIVQTAKAKRAATKGKTVKAAKLKTKAAVSKLKSKERGTYFKGGRIVKKVSSAKKEDIKAKGKKKVLTAKEAKAKKAGKTVKAARATAKKETGFGKVKQYQGKDAPAKELEYRKKSRVGRRWETRKAGMKK